MIYFYIYIYIYILTYCSPHNFKNEWIPFQWMTSFAKAPPRNTCAMSAPPVLRCSPWFWLSLRMPQNLRKIMGRWPTAEPRQRRDSELGKIPSLGFCLWVFQREVVISILFCSKISKWNIFCFFVKMWIWREILKSSQFPGRLVHNWQTYRLKSHSLMRLATQVVLWTSTYGLHPREVRTQGCCSTWQRCERSNMWSKLMKTPWAICWEALSFDLKQLLGTLLADFYFCDNFDFRIFGIVLFHFWWSGDTEWRASGVHLQISLLALAVMLSLGDLATGMPERSTISVATWAICAPV